jgi:microcystin-dependent protein
MTEPYLSEIKMVSWGFAAKGWALANGQILPINQNQALFSLLGTTFGGNGIQTFELPNLQSRIPMHTGQGAGLTVRHLGDLGGSEGAAVALIQETTVIPKSLASPVSSNIGYRATGFTATSPFIVLNFLIALQGIFPSQS